MAIWRSYELEQLLGGDLDERGITAAALERLVQTKAVEGDQLDYKANASSVSQRPGQSAAPNEFCKDVAAFANGRGGILLYGISETAGAPDQIVGLPGADLDSVAGTMVTQLGNYVSPVPQIDVVPVRFDDDTICLAVVVPPSDRAPQGVSSRTRAEERRPLDYPVRSGAHTRWMTEPEIASRYLERGQSAANRADRRTRLIIEAKAQLKLSDSVWIYMAVVPERPIAAALTVQFDQEATAWLPALQATSPLHNAFLTLPRHVIAPGRVILTDSNRQVDAQAWMGDVYVELHTDGAAFVAVDGMYRADSTRRDQRQLDLLDLVDALILAAQIAPRWARDQAGTIGEADMAAGVSCQFQRAEQAQIDLHHSLPGDRHDRIPTARGMMQHDPSMSGPIAVVDAIETREQLLIARQAAAGILQWFGLIEPA